jgi:hypothetical protein
MDLAFLRAEYEAEWQRRDQLQAAASMPLAVLTVLGSALVILIRQYHATSVLASLLFWGALLLAGFSYVAATWMLVRSFYGYVYRRLPLASSLRTYQQDLRAYYERGKGGDEETIAGEFRAHLAEAYVEAIDRNAVNNTNRGEYLYKANSAAVVCLICTAAAAVPFTLAQRTAESVPQSVYITNLPGSTMSQESKPTTDSAAKPADAPPTVPPITKPSFPTNLDLRTGMKEPKPKLDP